MPHINKTNRTTKQQMRLEDLLKDTKSTTNKQLELVRKWEDTGLLEGLSSSGDTNIALLLESQPKQKINEFKSPGVYAKDHTSDGVRYNAPIDTIIDDGGISGDMSGINALVEEFEVILPDYLLNDPEVVGYPDLEMQNDIYQWVLQDLPMWVNATVKDFGAGRGDFSAVIYPNLEYIGFEKKESLVLAGQKKYEIINLICSDYFNSDLVTDYTICIGTLSEDHGFDKWEYFNKILNHAISNTKIAIIFVLSKYMDETPGFLDYPFTELFTHLPKDVRFTIDYTRMEDIYKLTVHIGGYNK